MSKSAGDPQPTVASSESSSNRVGNRSVSEEEKSAEQTPASGEAAVEGQDWWSAQPTSEWAQPAASSPADTDPAVPKEAATADVYFCGHTTLLSLNRALQAIAREKLTGVLRAFWDQESVELLVQDGGIVFTTTRDPELYCPDAPAVLANVDAEVVAKARAQQSETGAPFFLTLAGQDLIARQPAVELVQHYGRRLFSQLWTAPHVWIMFEKNSELLSDARDVPGETNVDDWALESLRLIQSLDQPVSLEPASIPAYTRDGYERIQKLKLTSDEAQFASQFNGTRSIQQIAKNLRLDLKSAHMMLFRFLTLGIVECWPATTTPEPERRSVFQRLKESIRRGR